MFFGPRVYKGLGQVEVCFLKKITLREVSAEQTGELHAWANIYFYYLQGIFFFSLVVGSYPTRWSNTEFVSQVSKPSKFVVGPVYFLNDLSCDLLRWSAGHCVIYMCDPRSSLKLIFKNVSLLWYLGELRLEVLKAGTSAGHEMSWIPETGTPGQRWGTLCTAVSPPRPHSLFQCACGHVVNGN